MVMDDAVMIADTVRDNVAETIPIWKSQEEQNVVSRITHDTYPQRTKLQDAPASFELYVIASGYTLTTLWLIG